MATVGVVTAHLDGPVLRRMCRLRGHSTRDDVTVDYNTYNHLIGYIKGCNC